jgi:hypothetical protein
MTAAGIVHHTDLSRGVEEEAEADLVDDLVGHE